MTGAAARTAGCAQQRFRVTFKVEKLARGLEQLDAERCQTRRLSPSAVEELDPIGALESANLCRHRRLGAAQEFRGAHKPASAGDGIEGLQVVQAHRENRLCLCLGVNPRIFCLHLSR
jgi:hypothetical protein